MLVAIGLRLPAVIFSKGYMASDDYYETVDVAYRWAHGSMWSPDGHLAWYSTPKGDIARFPLYNLFVYSLIKVGEAFGDGSLDSTMYFVRAIHALLSLLSVWALFKIVEISTGSKRWAMIGGLIAAMQFAMPFLSVRNLIEVVGGHMWILALLALYLYDKEQRTRWVIVAGLLTGLAWMIRFELAFAVLPVPLVLWWVYRKLRPALWYCAAVSFMIFLSGVIDYLLIGQFMASTINRIVLALHSGGMAMYNTTIFIYPLLILCFFVPPFSLLVFWKALRYSFWRNHLILFVSLAFYIGIHTMLVNRQERFMIPMIPALTALIVLALEHWSRAENSFARTKGFRYGIVAPSLVLNSLLLVLFTFNYGKRGLVEPLVEVHKLDSAARVLIVAPEQRSFYPFAYADSDDRNLPPLQSWADFPRPGDPDPLRDSFDYLIVYPPEPSDLPRYLDSLRSAYGTLQEVDHVPPSNLDLILHKLNPAHNRRNEAWVYRRPLAAGVE